MPKSRMNETNFVGIDREARLVAFVAGLLPVDRRAEYIRPDPHRADPWLIPLKIGNGRPGSIGRDALLGGYSVTRPQGATR